MFSFWKKRRPATALRPAVRRRVPSLETLEDRTVPTLLGNNLFPADNPWNQKIADAPVAANSAAVMQNILGTYGDGLLHPDFSHDYHGSADLYGIPYNVVHGNSAAKVHVVIDAYPGESDLQDCPIPADAVLEGDYQNGPHDGAPGVRGDSHLIVYDVDNNVSYEFYNASRPSENADGQWHADGESVWDMKADSFRTLGYTSADAAGLAILPGLVRPDEALPVSEGGQGVINHAIRFTLDNAVILDQFLYPASHTANVGNNDASIMPPMGARFRLKAGVDISQLAPESRVIAQAMKDYGLIVADNGSNFFIGGASSSVDASNHDTLTFNDNDIQDFSHGLKSLHFSDFEMVDLTPRVSGLSLTGGPARTTVTVTGQNFSGAAGHLQVFFGGTPASSVTVIDDSHVTAVVPAGTGTVDVRVQSGTPDPNDPSNVNGVFGYGVSAVSAADRFTYGGVTVAAPSTNPPPRNLWQAALAITHSDEQYSNFITNAYQSYLGRAPEAAGLGGWLQAMRNGFSDEQLEAGFIGSAEYIANHGGQGAGWVTGMYRDLLGRTPAQSEVDGWLQTMAQGTTPQQVAYGFAASAERESIRVRDDYLTYLGRAAGQAEVDGWLAAFENGNSNENVVAGFVGSAEYYDAVSKGDGDPATWVRSAYRAVLKRSPSDAEVNGWLPFLS